MDRRSSYPGLRLYGTALLLAALATCWAPVIDAQVYRYRDRDGQWVYTDRPPDDPARAARALSLAAGGGDASPRILVEPRSTPDGLAMVAVNQCRCPVEFGVQVRTTGGPRVARQVVAPESEAVLVQVSPPPGQGRIAFDYAYVIGEPDAAHAPRQPYRAPYAAAQSFTVTQAPPDAITHTDPSSRYAIDIAMPVGTPVHAARGGVVINAARGFFRGGLRIENMEQANFVEILHDDGTYAIYAHLQMDTVRVRPGQRVARGEYIANSGNTGYSSGPHLHFVVLRNAGLRAESVPVTFAGPGGTAIAAVSGRELTAY